MDIDLVAEYRALERLKQTPEVTSLRKELFKRILEHDLAEQQRRLARYLSDEWALERDKWDAAWDSGLVEEVIRVKKQQKEKLLWVTQSHIL